MSLRNLKKLLAKKVEKEPEPEDSSDEDFEPLCVQSAFKPRFQGLQVSDHSEKESNAESSESESQGPEELSAKQKKKKNKKKKQDELDEIDRSVKAVNAILGSPQEAGPSRAREENDDPAQAFMAVHPKHLVAANELRRIFGPEDPENEKRKRGRQPNLQRLVKRNLLVPTSDAYENFRRVGLTMSVEHKEGDITFFTYDHSEDYQKMHKHFLRTYTTRQQYDFDSSRSRLHVEAIIEDADVLCLMEEYTKANTFLELAIAFMQFCAHPSFSLTNGKTRLEYKYLENRAFHIGILKYLHMLTNRACHRTALEMAKILLNLDPCDPLAVLLIIDVLAIRAREHQWLIDAVDHWATNRQSEFLFNIQYSYAMCHLQIAHKKKADLSYADELLQNAIMRFPTVVIKILEFANHKISDNMKNCALYSEQTTPKNLQDLITMYAKFVWSRFRERPVLGWLVRNAEELVDKYHNDIPTRENVMRLTNKRLNLFQAWPVEVVRHLCIIKPMAQLLVDGAVPNVTTATATNPPPPPSGVDRYGYVRPPAHFITHRSTPRFLIYEFFHSLLPNFALNQQQINPELLNGDLPQNFEELVGVLGELQLGMMGEEEEEDEEGEGQEPPANQHQH